MKILIPLFLLVAIFFSTASCQTSLVGKITDGKTGEELIAANVALYKAGLFITGIAADFDGNYSINLDPGTYDMVASYVGYGSTKVNGIVVRAGVVNKLSVAMGTGVNSQVVLHNNRGHRQDSKGKGIEFHSPDKERLVREVLGNVPEEH